MSTSPPPTTSTSATPTHAPAEPPLISTATEIKNHTITLLQSKLSKPSSWDDASSPEPQLTSDAIAKLTRLTFYTSQQLTDTFNVSTVCPESKELLAKFTQGIMNFIVSLPIVIENEVYDNLSVTDLLVEIETAADPTPAQALASPQTLLNPEHTQNILRHLNRLYDSFVPSAREITAQLSEPVIFNPRSFPFQLAPDAPLEVPYGEALPSPDPPGSTPLTHTSICVVCLESATTVQLAHSNGVSHQCCCSSCADQLMASERPNCPICRKHIVLLIKQRFVS
mmetsp:Transcript_14191/g.29149  ORF Transcript_14191/g.29149 Transcript_14191/m.29149 type:complete len:282 (-) Transcript_14191:51-896(-)